MALPSPDSARGWLATLYPLMERGGGVLALAFLLIGASMVWFLIGALERSVARNHALTERLLTMQDMHRQELLRYVHCERSP